MTLIGRGSTRLFQKWISTFIVWLCRRGVTKTSVLIVYAYVLTRQPYQPVPLHSTAGVAKSKKEMQVEPDYVVSKILKHAVHRGWLHFCVQWAGLVKDVKDGSSWEPADQFLPRYNGK